MNSVLLLPFVGGVYLAEALSVILQLQAIKPERKNF
jgi:hypothetical protein